MSKLCPFRFSVLFGLALCLAPMPGSPVQAQGVGGQLLPAGRDWLAVGRMDIGQRGFCTVTLIGPDRALTAAHCLVDGHNGQPHPLQDLQVRLGYRHDRAVVTRGVRDVLTPRRAAGSQVPGGQAVEARAAGGRPDEAPDVADDLAILILDQPVRLAQLGPVALAAGGADDGQVLSVVSYAQGRAQEAALQDDCIVITRRVDGALVLDCTVDHGASGAPVMDMRGGEPRIVAVISARAEMQLQGFPNAVVALAAPMDGVAGRALLRAEAAARGAAPAAARAAGSAAAPGGVRIRRPGEGSGLAGGSGARFVRPESSVPTTDPVIR